MKKEELEETEVGGPEETGKPAQAEGLEIYPEADGCVVYQPQRDKVHFLNHTAVFLLELCDGEHGVGEIGEIFRETFKPAEDPGEAVAAILKQFSDEELVTL